MPEKKKGVVPRLRFPEFRDAGPWEVKRLGEVFRFIPTNSLSRARLTYDCGQVRNIHYGDIHTKFSSLFNIEKEEVPFINDGINLEDFDADSFCLPGDVIFADASEDIDDIGKAIEVVNVGEEKIVSGLHTLHARQKEAVYIVGFSGYLFQTDAIKKQIQRESQGVKVLGISATRLAKIKIVAPNKEEQQKIADCLSSLDELIELEAKRLEALKAHKKGLMQQLFPREGETVPRLRFPEFRDAGPWEVKRLGEVCEINPATGELPQSFVYIDLESVEAGRLIQRKRISKHDAPSRAQRILQKGDIIFQMVRPYQKNNLLFDIDNSEYYVASTGYAQLRANESNIFLYQIVHTEPFTASILKRCTGSNYPAISSSELATVRIAIPSLPEKQKIADCLSSLDEVIELQTRRLDALKAHKKGLMQRLFPQEVD